MTQRTGEPWDDDEIELLDQFLQSGVPLSVIAKGLSRTETAVKHAVSKLVYQQLLDHTPMEIATRYKKKLDWITEEIVDPKYYIDFDYQEPEQPSTDSVTGVLVTGFMLGLATLVVSGMGYYGCMLYDNGFST